MRHFARFDESGNLLSIGTGDAVGVEITESEYDWLLHEIREKAVLVNSVEAGDVLIDSVHEEWRDEIRDRVDERKARLQSTPLDAQEIVDILVGADISMTRDDAVKLKKMLDGNGWKGVK
jgi:hypothetical protein